MLIASMTLEGAMGEAMAVEGSTKAFVLEAYVEPGQVVVMDNLFAHKTERVRELIEGRGCELPWFLPAYSPDLNPIEEAFSKVKAHLRKAPHARGRPWWKRWAKRYLTARYRTPGAGSPTAATTGRGTSLHERRCETKRRAHLEWGGKLPSGRSSFTVGSGAIDELPVTWALREHPAVRTFP